jgi:hypothetical protein
VCVCREPWLLVAAHLAGRVASAWLSSCVGSSVQQPMHDVGDNMLDVASCAVGRGWRCISNRTGICLPIGDEGKELNTASCQVVAHTSVVN